MRNGVCDVYLQLYSRCKFFIQSWRHFVEVISFVNKVKAGIYVLNTCLYIHIQLLCIEERVNFIVKSQRSAGSHKSG